MKVGVPTEIKTDEYRVAMTPSGVRELAQQAHDSDLIQEVLRAMEAVGGANLRVQIHNTERFTEEAALAEKRYNITPQKVETTEHGAHGEGGG